MSQFFRLHVSRPDDGQYSEEGIRSMILATVGGNYIVSATEITEPDELKVGDRVRVDIPEPATVECIYAARADVRWPDGYKWGAVEVSRLIKLPPIPTHRVEYEHDRLNLIRSESPESGAEFVCDHIDMHDPVEVDNAIIHWAEHDGIDADEVRKMSAEPKVIELRPLSKHTSCAAIRTATGWHARVSVFESSFQSGETTDGMPVNESDGRGLFPEVKGPYREPEKP